ncbi:MAG TPA: sigma 54-interacting transcriptional regulator [Kofleriaceae bacterium]|nr:sigma 54-interacting transcriptional regulator [Kofleriaceae bacterium]
MRSTIDDASSAAGGSADLVPVVVVAAVGTTPAARVFPADREVALGRRVEAGTRAADLDDERMSREHATVRFERGAWVVIDRGSRNGTFVDGERITGEVRKRGNVVVRLGHTVFLLVPDGRGYDQLGDDRGEHVIGPELARLHDQVRRLADSPTLLVHGESGSGKELIARLYHGAGPRAGGPFVAVNCATIPEGVAERLLFGARKGAFSGAQDAVGYLQAAHGGTLFLDEIADLDLAVQAKLLRALETREVTPVGANAPIAIELGIVAASHRELRAAVATRDFRDDLYYRLARAVVHLPPLRARKLDVARLVVRELAAADRGLAAHARLIEACCIRPWPGNVRELRAAVDRAAGAARAAGRDVVRPEDLPEHAGLPVGDAPAAASPDSAPVRAAPAALDKAAIVAALDAAGGVVSVAARALGLHRTQLYRLMDKHGIARDE